MCVWEHRGKVLVLYLTNVVFATELFNCGNTIFYIIASEPGKMLAVQLAYKGKLLDNFSSGTMKNEIRVVFGIIICYTGTFYIHYSLFTSIY